MSWSLSCGTAGIERTGPPAMRCLFGARLERVDADSPRGTLTGMNTLPETILQFGAGNFLRAFADLFVHQANQQGQNVGRAVVVQSTGDARAQLLNQQGGRYHVVIRELENGQVVDRVEES